MAEEGEEIAPALLAKPELLPHQQAQLEAFMLLCPDRPIGMGCVGAIPTVAIYAAADTLGEDRQEFLALCRLLDCAYLERIQKKRPRPKSKK